MKYYSMHRHSDAILPARLLPSFSAQLIDISFIMGIFAIVCLSNLYRFTLLFGLNLNQKGIDELSSLETNP